MQSTGFTHAKEFVADPSSSILSKRRIYIEEFGRILRERLREIEEQLETSPHPDLLKREMIEAKSAQVRVILGTYGTCEACGETIRHERLMHSPYARYCIECQREFENKLARRPGRL